MCGVEGMGSRSDRGGGPESACASTEQVLSKYLSNDWMSAWQHQTRVIVILFIHFGGLMLKNFEQAVWSWYDGSSREDKREARLNQVRDMN